MCTDSSSTMASSSHVGEKRRRKTYLEVSTFRAPHTHMSFDMNVSTRKISVERLWDENFLRNIVKFEYLDQLKSWGWWKLLSLGREIISEELGCSTFLVMNMSGIIEGKGLSIQ